MPKTRYYKTPEQLASSTSNNQDITKTVITSIVVDYKTDPEAIVECMPPHLTPNKEGLIRATLSQCDVQLGETMNFAFGAVNIGIPCKLDDEDGNYCLHMYMNQETPVVIGREIYGEPKKIADIDFQRKPDGEVSFTATRHFCPFINFKGQIGEALEPKTEKYPQYVYKMFPAIDGNGFEYPPRLNRLWAETEETERYKLEGELSFIDSPMDPIADFPVLEVVDMYFYVGSSISGGEFVKEVDGDSMLGYYHQRCDDLDALLGG